jgi:hypothetical protein
LNPIEAFETTFINTYIILRLEIELKEIQVYQRTTQNSFVH